MWSKVKEHFNIDKIVQRINDRATVLNSKAVHAAQTAQNIVKNINTGPDHSFEAAQARMKKKGPDYFFRNINVSAYSQSVKRLFEGNDFAKRVSKLAGSKWGKLGIKASLVLFAGSFIYGAINPKKENAIPKNYERGYHLMNETLTDFGSPVKLDKAAHKVIVPYHSSIRNNVITSTAAITNNNIALLSNKNAIGHTRY